MRLKERKWTGSLFLDPVRVGGLSLSFSFACRLPDKYDIP